MNATQFFVTLFYIQNFTVYYNPITIIIIINFHCHTL